MNQIIKRVGTMPGFEITDTELTYRTKTDETTIKFDNVTSFEVTDGTFTEYGYLTILESGREHKVEYVSTYNKTMRSLQNELGFQNVNQPLSVKKPKEKKTLAQIEAEMPDSWKEKQAEKAKVAQMKKDKIPFCPKCHSTSITYKDKKLSIGRAVVGGAIAGGAGAILGGLTSKGGKVKCLNCGHEWKI